MKIRYLKEKAQRQLNLQYEEIQIHFFICILVFIFNFKMLFRHNYKTKEQNYSI